MELWYKCYQLPLKHQFIVANSKKNYAENVFVELRHQNNIGYGEAAPSYFYHESTDTIHQFFDQIKLSLNSNPTEIDLIMGRLEKKFRGNYAAKAAINMALFDLVSKKHFLPLYQMLNIKNERSLFTSFTIGIDSIEIIEEKVKVALNFPVLKVKLGTNHDYEIIERIRKITNCPLRIDANEGWSKTEAVEKINWLETQNVEFVEQPLLANDIERG